MRGQALQGGGVSVAAQHGQSALDGQIAADGFAHDAQANEAGSLKFRHEDGLRKKGGGPQARPWIE
ncbi:hypothetical protein D3C85_1659610 [compost metagenome]